MTEDVTRLRLEPLRDCEVVLRESDEIGTASVPKDGDSVGQATITLAPAGVLGQELAAARLRIADLEREVVDLRRALAAGAD